MTGGSPLTPITLCVAPNCGGDGDPRQAADGLLICLPCSNRLRRDLGAAPALYRWLGEHVMPGTSGGDRVSGGRVEAPVPARLDVLCMINDGAVAYRGDDDDQVGPPSIPSTLKNWVWLVCEHRGLVYPAAAGVPELAAFLARHVEWAASREWIVDFMEEIGALRRAAHGLAPWTVHVQELVGPCPGCDLRALIRTAGEEWIECDVTVGGCGGLWSLAYYNDHVSEILKGKAIS
ncbi:hypothetical protein GCM10009560_16080 [Nonomuraea longicatena]|uniref:Uncharacterized protein n=1 Tax=Nonomuraea longicatena TaxID=83682 RepID=A0ABN1NZ14_9ACTN